MRQKLFLLVVVASLSAVAATGWAKKGDLVKTGTSFDPLFKEVYSASQGVTTARGTLSGIYDKSREIASLQGVKKKYSNTEILGILASRRSELTKDQLSYFTDALTNATAANQQNNTSIESCQKLQPRLEEAIEKAPEELMFQPWKVGKVIKGLKNSLVQVNQASKEGAVLAKELAEVIPLLQKINR